MKARGAVRESVQLGDLAWGEELIAAHHRLAGAGKSPRPAGEAPSDEWMTAHVNFHAELEEACPRRSPKEAAQRAH